MTEETPPYRLSHGFRPHHEPTFRSICDAVRSQADSMLMLADAMAREAQKQADSLERLTEWVMETPSLSNVCPELRGVLDRRINFWLKDTIAFLRELGGPHD